jgi:hypothetical protein
VPQAAFVLVILGSPVLLMLGMLAAGALERAIRPQTPLPRAARIDRPTGAELAGLPDGRSADGATTGGTPDPTALPRSPYYPEGVWRPATTPERP